jgi:hypothetical protein
VAQAGRPAGIEGALRRELDAKKQDDAYEAVRAQLAAEGLTVLEEVTPNRQHGPWYLSSMPWVDVDGHAKGDCHGVMIDRWNHTVRAYCLDPEAHPDPGRLERDAEEEQRKAERQARAEAAHVARRQRWEFVCGLVRKGNPDAGAALVVQLVVGSEGGGHRPRVDDDAVAEALGLTGDTFGETGPGEAVRAFVAKGTRNAQRGVYAVAVVMGEEACACSYADYDVCVRQGLYLRHLQAAGYQLSGVDQTLLDEADEYVRSEDAEAEAQEEHR